MREIINEGTVLDFYLEQMDNDNITFLKNKKDSKAQIRELIKEINELRVLSATTTPYCQG